MLYMSVQTHLQRGSSILAEMPSQMYSCTLDKLLEGQGRVSCGVRCLLTMCDEQTAIEKGYSGACRKPETGDSFVAWCSAQDVMSGPAVDEGLS